MNTYEMIFQGRPKGALPALYGRPSHYREFVKARSAESAWTKIEAKFDVTRHEFCLLKD